MLLGQLAATNIRHKFGTVFMFLTESSNSGRL
jgi:hypothetical protein